MAVKNSLVAKPEEKKIPFTVQIQSKGYQNLINTTLRDKNTANRFIASITSAVSANPVLQECDAGTILSAGLLGEGLKLSPSPQLGQYYLVPFNDNKSNRKVAQFQLGYKGYIQLAIRSGQYKKLNVLPIKQGELIHFDPLEEEIEVQLIENEVERENSPTIGYYAMFEYVNGFKKAIYWSKEKMLSHADKYSAAFSANGGTITTKNGSQKTKVSFADYEARNYNEKDSWMYSSFWYKDFDGMACKTMLRQLISKWGIMSIEMERAVTNDMAVINEQGEAEYIETISETEEVIETTPNFEESTDLKTTDQLPFDDFSSIMEG